MYWWSLYLLRIPIQSGKFGKSLARISCKRYAGVAHSETIFHIDEKQQQQQIDAKEYFHIILVHIVACTGAFDAYNLIGISTVR